MSEEEARAEGEARGLHVAYLAIARLEEDFGGDERAEGFNDALRVARVCLRDLRFPPEKRYPPEPKEKP